LKDRQQAQGGRRGRQRRDRRQVVRQKMHAAPRRRTSSHSSGSAWRPIWDVKMVGAVPPPRRRCSYVSATP